MNYNPDDAKLFFELLGQADSEPFISFLPESKECKEDSNTRATDSPRQVIDDAAISRLAEANIKLGFGVFAAVNTIAPAKRRTKDNVIKVNAVFADDDVERESYRTDWPIKPSFIVCSSHGKYHYYWLCKGLTTEEFTFIQKGIAEKFNTDPSISDPNRLMRVPGFYHLKDKPFLSHIIKESININWEV